MHFPQLHLKMVNGKITTYSGATLFSFSLSPSQLELFSDAREVKGEKWTGKNSQYFFFFSALVSTYLDATKKDMLLRPPGPGYPEAAGNHSLGTCTDWAVDLPKN